MNFLEKKDKTIEEVVQWVEGLVDIENDTEDTLQEKIIEFYSVLEQKTIENMEMKKQNEKMQAQITAYIDIIRKLRENNQQNNESEMDSSNGVWDKLNNLEQKNRKMEKRLKQLQSNLTVKFSSSIETKREDSFMKKEKKYVSIEDLWKQGKNTNQKKTLRPLNAKKRIVTNYGQISKRTVKF